MSDPLERVREITKLLCNLAFGMESPDLSPDMLHMEAERILDTHLKEDAERDAKLVSSRYLDADAALERAEKAEAELIELREAVRAHLAERDTPTWGHAAEYAQKTEDRLRQLIEERKERNEDAESS